MGEPRLEQDDLAGSLKSGKPKVGCGRGDTDVASQIGFVEQVGRA